MKRRLWPSLRSSEGDSGTLLLQAPQNVECVDDMQMLRVSVDDGVQNIDDDSNQKHAKLMRKSASSDSVNALVASEHGNNEELLLPYSNVLLSSANKNERIWSKQSSKSKSSEPLLPIYSDSSNYLTSLLAGRRRRFLFYSLSVLLVVFSYLIYTWAIHGGALEPDRSVWKSVSRFTPETDERWERVLRSERIVHSKRFAPAGAASHKFIVHFADGAMAMAKPVQCLKLILGWRATVFERDLHENLTLVADPVCQGWPDIVAYRVDRALGFFRRPVAVGRLISNKELYSGAQLWASDWENTLNWLLWWLPSYSVECLLQPWLDNFHEGQAVWPAYQSMHVNRFLALDGRRQAPKSALERVRPADRYQLLDVSDTLVFDYLLDDHDREAEKNWVTMIDGGGGTDASGGGGDDDRCWRLSQNGNWQLPCPTTLLLWDSGLGFQHGPQARELWHSDRGDGVHHTQLPRDCRTIFRGSNYWRRSGAQHVCRFRASTYRRLRAFDAAHPQPLSSHLSSSLELDDLWPLFHYGVYSIDGGGESWRNRVRFTADSFLHGMDVKVARILDHIHWCIDRHGSEQVLLADHQLLESNKF
jgi:hypothetical protein